MKTTKEKVLFMYPDIEKRVRYQLKSIGRKGHAGIEGVLELWRNGVFICSDSKTKRAYATAFRIPSK